MRAVRVVVALVLAGTATSSAAAQDPPPAPPVVPGAEAPTQDADALAALRALSALAPSPGAAGFKEMRCTVTVADAPPFLMPVVVRWPAGQPVAIEVDVRGAPMAADVAQRFEGLLRTRIGMAFVPRTFWDPAVVAACNVAAERAGTSLVVRISEPRKDSAAGVLTIGPDGLPTEFAMIPSGGAADAPHPRFRLGFAPHGRGRALSRVEFGPDAAQTMSGSVQYFDATTSFAMPRRIEWRLPDGRKDVYVVHDVHLDGKRVEGTSLAESVAGRVRRVDPGARALFDKLDAATATPATAGVREASCRVDYQSPSFVHHLRVAWTPEGVASCEVEAPLPGEPAIDPAQAAGARKGFSTATSGLLRPASSDYEAFDAATDAADRTGAAISVILTPLDTSVPLAMLGFESNEHGLLVNAVQKYRDGGPDGTVARTYERRGAGWVLAEEVVVRGEDRMTTSFTWFDAAGFPPLRRTVVRDAKSTKGTFTFRQTYSDWVVDGKPVPGTARAAVDGGEKR